MKNLIILLPLIFTLSAFSQTEKPLTKGNMIITGGGTIQYTTINSTVGSDTYKQNLFEVSLNPGIGYFFINNLAIGLNTSFTYYSTDNSQYYSLGIGPTVKYYFGNGILIKGESNFSFLHGLGDNTANQKVISLKPGVGYGFFINPKVSLEPCLNYIFNSYKDEYDGSDHKLTSNGLQIELTIVVFL